MDINAYVILKKVIVTIVISGFLYGTQAVCIADEWPVAAQPNGLSTKYPQQLELLEYERFLGKQVVLHENPLFHNKVSQGELPSVEYRLPSEPLVVLPNKENGKYGGTLNGLALSYESGTSEILSWRQANLVRFSDDNRTIVPNVAKSWEWNKDHSEITFFLRKGHRWSDGTPFTADDILFYLYDIILNKELHKHPPSPWESLEPKAEKINETCIKFIFKKPYTSMLFYFGGNGSYHDPFAPKHFLKQFHIKYNPNADKQAKAKGFENWAAQFRIYWNRWKDGVISKASGLEVPTLESHILKEAPTPSGRIFIANPYYFKIDTAGNQLPYIDFHKERFLEKKNWIKEIIEGRVDQKSQNMPLNSYPELKENQKNGNYTLQMPFTGIGPAILFNKTHKDPIQRAIYAEPKFNYAASLAINRNEINKKLFLNLCKPQQALPQNIPFATAEDKQYMAQYDPAKANKFLDEIGLKKGPDGYRLRADGNPFIIPWEYSLQYVWSHELPKLIAGYWNAVGLRVDLKEVPTKVARANQISNNNDLSNEWPAPFEPTLFSTPLIFMPPFGVAHPVSGIAWWQWKNSNGTEGEEPPLWVKHLWEIGDEFTTLIPGSNWYNALGKEIIRINLKNLSVIGTLAEVPLITVVSNKLGNVSQWGVNSYYYGYAYPQRADQWFFK